MDFFDYANIVHYFINTDTWYVKYIVGGLCFLIVFVFQAVGLFIISGREGYKNRWMAFVPFLNTYYIGVCGQKNRTFKSVDTRIFSLVAAILEALLVVGYVINDIAWMYLKAYNLIEYVDTTNGYGLIWPIETLSSNIREFPELFWAGWCFEFLDKFILSFLELAFLVMQVFTLSAFFQTFAARRYMLFTVTSILFPVQGILIFILRNNRGMNYRDFIRKEQERQYRMYQQYRQQQSFDQNPYNQNPYSRNPYEDDGSSSAGSSGTNGNNSSKSGSADDPFSEFGGKDGNNDPFEN
ncbi:MAG: hypothetical protein K2K38_01255 [Clostridia bacterium]|nr:hypothetical protein [Clostridia bacterium]